MRIKTTLIILFFVSLSFEGRSQISFGIRAGANASLFIGQDVSSLAIADVNGKEVEPQIRLGFHVGGYAKLPISDFLYLQPELLYSTKGVSQRNIDKGPIDATYHTNLHYVDLPVLLGITPMERFSFFIGPQASYFLSGKRRLENEIFNWAEVSKPADADSMQVRRFNVSGVVGVGYEFTNGINISARGEYGILPIAVLFKAGVKEDFAVNNLAFQLSVGYTFKGSDNYYRNKKKRR